MSETVDAPVPPTSGPGNTPVRIDVGHLVHDAFEAAEEINRPRLTEIYDPGSHMQVPAVVTTSGLDIISPDKFNAWRDHPVALKGTAHFTRLQSLIDHANRFKGPHSALFACDDPAKPMLSAVLDYSTQDTVRWGRHLGSYSFPLDPGWQAWTAVDGKWLDVGDCAEFVENHWTDIAQIDDAEGLDELTDRLAKATGYTNVAGPSRMLELSKGFSVHEHSAVSDIRRLATGEAQIVFTSEHVDSQGAPLKIPNLFVLALPVFRYGMIARMAVRFRYAKVAGLKLKFDLCRPDLVFDRALYEAAQRAAAETSLPLFYGRPEVQ